MPTGRLTMSNKRRREDLDHRARRHRRNKRSHSEPLPNDSDNEEKRYALKRLFGRVCSVERRRIQQEDVEMPEQRNPGRQQQHQQQQQRQQQQQQQQQPQQQFGDENEDPLLGSIPVDMDPEQLGFLVCAQETLRFLHGRGIRAQHPVFDRLRIRLLQGIDELGMA